jgi:hypothetical protein
VKRVPRSRHSVSRIWAAVCAASWATLCLRGFRPLARALLSAGLAILTVVAPGAPQGTDTDSGWQFKAVQQHLQGSSPTFNTLVSPNPHDLSIDRTEWISWWAPGSALLVWPLMALHLALGTAVRVVAILCLLGGSVGWSFWIDAFLIPRWAKLLLSVSIPWSYYAHHNSLFFYGAEALLFAAVPWTLLLTVRLSRGPASGPTPHLLAAATGLSLGLLYVLKYSGILVAIGALTYLALQAARQRRPRTPPSPRTLQLAGVCAFSCLLPILALNLLNFALASHMNLVTASRSLNVQWSTLLFGIANPALAAASAEAPLRHLLLHPTVGLVPGAAETWLAVVGLPGGALLLLVLLRRPPSSPHAQLASCLLVMSVAGVMVLWTITDSITYESRHVAGASIAVLPYVLQEAWALRFSSRTLRAFLVLCGCAYVILPLLYGVSAVIGKTARGLRHHTGPSRVYNPLLARQDVAHARSLLVAGFDPTSDLWYVTHPVPALDLPGRALIRPDALLTKPHPETFTTSRPVRVRLILPVSMETNGKAAVIRRSFPTAVGWTSCPTDGTTHCSTSWIAPSPLPPGSAANASSRDDPIARATPPTLRDLRTPERTPP